MRNFGSWRFPTGPLSFPPSTPPWLPNLNQDGGSTKSEPGPVALCMLRPPPDSRDPIPQAIGLPVLRRCVMVTHNLSRCQLMISEDRKPTTSREPAPTNYTRLSIGDVGFIRRGQFHLLFSAGSPLGDRKPGEDVPMTFKPLIVGALAHGEPRRPCCLRSNTVTEVGADLGASLPTTSYVLSLRPLSTCLRMHRPAP